MQVYTLKLSSGCAYDSLKCIHYSENQIHAVQPYCFSLYKTNGSYKLQWGCTLCWAEILTNSTKNAEQSLRFSVGWLKAVHHCSLKMKKALFVELIGRFTCLNPMNHVTRSQRSEKFSSNLHGQGLHDPRWSFAYKANDSTISSEW